MSLCVLNAGEMNCFSSQSVVNSDELSAIIEESKILIDSAKKRGLSDAEIIEELDPILMQAALADQHPIQGKGANLKRLLWTAAGAGTALLVIACIHLIVGHLNVVSEVQNEARNQGQSHNDGSGIIDQSQQRVTQERNDQNQENNNIQEPELNNNQQENMVQGQQNNDPVNNVYRGRRRARNNVQPTRHSSRTRHRPVLFGDRTR